MANPNDAVILNYSQNPVEYKQVPKVWLTHPDSTEEDVKLVPFTYGEAEEVTVDADFSGGDMVIEPQSGKLFSKVTVTAPADGGGGLIDYVNDTYNCTSAVQGQYSKFNGVRSMTFKYLQTLGGGTFENCADLQKLDFHNLTTIKTAEFPGCPLTALIIRTKSMCKITVSSNLNWMFTQLFQAKGPIDAGTGYIYVPASLVATYQADTIWSRWATQFRAIEDYPDICG